MEGEKRRRREGEERVIEKEKGRQRVPREVLALRSNKGRERCESTSQTASERVVVFRGSSVRKPKRG